MSRSEATASSTAPPKILFLDTEFADTGREVLPISIGIVKETGERFYAEVDSGWQMRTKPWVWENVAIHLDNKPEKPEAVRGQLKAFIGEERVRFCAYFAAFDWVIFCQLMGGLVQLPENVCNWILDTCWLIDQADPQRLERIKALRSLNEKPHHALHDALEVREQYRILTGK